MSAPVLPYPVSPKIWIQEEPFPCRDHLGTLWDDTDVIFHHFLPTSISGGFPLSCHKCVFLFSCSQTSKNPTKFQEFWKRSSEKRFGMQNFVVLREDFLSRVRGFSAGIYRRIVTNLWVSKCWKVKLWGERELKNPIPAQAGCGILLETPPLLRMKDFHGISCSGTHWAGSRVSVGSDSVDVLGLWAR